MTSLDVVPPALLLPIPFVSLLLSFYNSSSSTKRALFVLLAVLAAVAGGTALSVACGEPLRIVAKVFTVLLHTTLSAVSIYALFPFSPSFLQFSLSLAAILVACELVSALIPTSPLILPATLALASCAILLTLAMVTTVVLRYRVAAMATELNIEKGPSHSGDDPSARRVSSPTQATWPFPGSLESQDKSVRDSCPQIKSPPDLLPPSAAILTHHVAGDAYKMDCHFILLPLVLVIAQIFATLAAALDVAACILVDATTNLPLPHILIVSATCTLLSSFATLAIVQMLPTNRHPSSSEEEVALAYGQEPFTGDSGKISQDNTVARTPKPSFSRRESDSLLDFLSLRDPFASSPPPPPPLPPVGLGLDEVDVGWNGNKEIGMQYRFPAPRSIIKSGLRKGKNARANGNKRLVHQDSSRTLLPVPETRGVQADVEGDRGFGDEARLAQLLLQSLSLSEDSEDSESPNRSTPPVPTVSSPQAVHVQQSSRWSMSTTVQSVMSTSISNRSGVSTYTTCASERVPPSRISMSTIASALGGRKSSEARRKSAMTASSSKG